MKKLYSVFDDKAKSFSPLSAFENVDVALRVMRNLVNDDKNGFLFSNPEDFILYEVGSFNEETGEIVPDEHVVCRLIDVKGAKDE